MKTELPFLALTLAALTKLNVVLSAPALTGTQGNVGELGHSSSTLHEKVTPKSVAGGYGRNSLAQSHVKASQEGKSLHEKQAALDGFTARPVTRMDVEGIPANDLKRITHQDHLEKLDADGATHMANRVVDHVGLHLKDRDVAHTNIVNHGGTPGKMGTGKLGAQEHHTRHANAQKALNELVAPLKAVEQRANLKGERKAGVMALERQNHILDSTPVYTNEEFNKHVGPVSTFNSNEGVKEKGTDGGKAGDKIVIQSRL